MNPSEMERVEQGREWHKPCPFCGNPAGGCGKYTDNVGTSYVVCQRCGATGPMELEPFVPNYEAGKQWDQRRGEWDD